MTLGWLPTVLLNEPQATFYSNGRDVRVHNEKSELMSELVWLCKGNSVKYFQKSEKSNVAPTKRKTLDKEQSRSSREFPCTVDQEYIYCFIELSCLKVARLLLK